MDYLLFFLAGLVLGGFGGFVLGVVELYRLIKNGKVFV